MALVVVVAWQIPSWSLNATRPPFHHFTIPPLVAICFGWQEPEDRRGRNGEGTQRQIFEKLHKKIKAVNIWAGGPGPIDGPSSSTTFGYRLTSHREAASAGDTLWITVYLATFCCAHIYLIHFVEIIPASHHRVAPLITNAFCLGISFSINSLECVSARACACVCIYYSLSLAFILARPAGGAKCCGRSSCHQRGATFSLAILKRCPQGSLADVRSVSAGGT